MKIATAELVSVSPYSQSRFYEVDKKDKESPADAEVRTWRERCHANEDGFLFIPPMAFKNCIAEAAKFLSIQVVGKGKATWTKSFVAGVLVVEALTLPIKKSDVVGESVRVNSRGIRGGPANITKTFPLIPKWSGKVVFHIIDNAITEEIFMLHLKEAGQLIGVGRFRPRNGGYYGRFSVKKLDWTDNS